MPLQLKRRPKSPYWYIRGTLRGIRIEESTGTGDKRAADEILAKRSAEILSESIHGRSATATFAHAALSYLENGGKKRFTAKVIAYFGTTPLAQIDQDSLDRGARKLYPNAKPATVDRQFYAVVSAVLHHAAKRKWCPTPIIQRPTKPAGRIRWITIDEADRLIAACSDHLRPLVIFMLYTGARTGEALWLDWRDVDLGRAHVSFPETKNGDPRGVPLHPRVVAALANLDDQKNGEVFRRPDGKPYSRPKRSDDTSAGTRIKTAFKAACRRAGITNFHPHDCRHTWATWHYANNHDFTKLKVLGGWKTDSMVFRYAHANVSQHQASIDKLPGGKLGDYSKRKAKKHAK
ncbi:integrase [Bradyrhizobium sp. USDA 4524]|uniref:site-specific integrase n=1 Tax=unclassified Bradyrhizobium TaxID=2631580 RepID=UPI00209EFEDB|nr:MULTISPECIES: site-specific integrase [unclassified Bradyrhizobium]MCP1841289.1 integrase [Bradyrhizobium sp. USDA 4538]MCP1901852.1 integrase [Bradyrhizobium sp. USDA 4537]MCP1992491.1 integrase [Bradyrhizobium sp. USDA 4539]